MNSSGVSPTIQPKATRSSAEGDVPVGQARRRSGRSTVTIAIAMPGMNAQIMAGKMGAALIRADRRASDVCHQGEDTDREHTIRPAAQSARTTGRNATATIGSAR